MGKDFIQNLLENLSDEKALAERLSDLLEANKAAYQLALDNLKNSQTKANRRPKVAA